MLFLGLAGRRGRESEGARESKKGKPGFCAFFLRWTARSNCDGFWLSITLINCDQLRIFTLGFVDLGMFVCSSLSVFVFCLGFVGWRERVAFSFVYTSVKDNDVLEGGDFVQNIHITFL